MKYPCRNCVYFAACGDNMRTMPCKGRTTKTERKKAMTKTSYGYYTEYKGYAIDYNFYNENEYTVQYCGDDVLFKTEEEAKAFIDEVAE